MSKQLCAGDQIKVLVKDHKYYRKNMIVTSITDCVLKTTYRVHEGREAHAR